MKIKYFNQNFIKQYYKLTGQLGQELVNHYPTFLNINGKDVSLKNISKRFSSIDSLLLEKFERFYPGSILLSKYIRMLNNGFSITKTSENFFLRRRLIEK